MTAKDYLCQVEKLDAVIQNKLIEKDLWKDVALGITAHMDGEQVRSTGAKSKMAEAVEKCVDIEGEIAGLIDKMIGVKKDVIHTIENVDNPTEYNVLHMRYVQYLPLQEIADHYGKDYSWATTTHGRALKSVQDILDKRGTEAEVCDFM